MTTKLKFNKLKFSIILSCLMVGIMAQGQVRGFEKKSFLEGMTITGSLGATHYWGDLREAVFPQAFPFMDKSRLGGGLSVHKNVLDYLDVGVKGLFSKLEAVDDDKRPSTNNIYSFNSNIWEVGLDANIKFSNLIFGRDRKRLGTVGILGFGFNGYNSTAIVTYPDGTSSELANRPEARTSGKTVNTVFYYGLGLRYKLKNNWDLGIETALYNLGVDNLDGWRDDNSANDKYTYTALSLGYTIPSMIINGEKNKRSRRNAGKKDGNLETPDDRDNNWDYDENAKKEIDDRIEKEISDLDEGIEEISKVEEEKEEIDIVEDKISTADTEEPIEEDLLPLQPESFQNDVVFFELDESIASEYLNVQVKAISEKLKKHPNVKITLAGYADKVGGTEYNFELSQRRADWVKELLVDKFGISASRISTVAKGEAESFDEFNRKDRRVEVIAVE